MMAPAEIAEVLTDLARSEFQAAEKWASEQAPPWPSILLIEACRLLDTCHVAQFLAQNPANQLPMFDFELMLRGWNPFLGILLPHLAGAHGTPLVESTTSSRYFIYERLRRLGMAALLRESADMIKHGMVFASAEDNLIKLRMSDRCAQDYFLDQLEYFEMENLERQLLGMNVWETSSEIKDASELTRRLDALVFPWIPADNIAMVGYESDPDVEQYYFDRIAKNVSDAREDAGIHPESYLGPVTGEQLSAIAFLKISAYFRHIHLVDRAKEKFPEINYAMSLTIWKTKEETIDTIADFFSVPAASVAAIIDLMTAKPQHAEYFRAERTPVIPMFIQISEEQLLSPISSIFRNPFHTIRLMYEATDARGTTTISRPREGWMASELYHLFLGPRYGTMDNIARLSRRGETVTDIDAAILDKETGDLALFQLKWQDFNSYNIAHRRSRAKNFVAKVDAWANRTEHWIRDFGAPALLQALRLRFPSHQVNHIRLFAIGRSAARFRSYGYTPSNSSIAVCSWRQFMKLRYALGPASQVFRDLHTAIQSEYTKAVSRIPLRQEITAGKYRIVFEDIWNKFDDDFLSGIKH
jgi:hypothetical protein